jgi:hypothetical protein
MTFVSDAACLQGTALLLPPHDKEQGVLCINSAV